MVLHAIIAMAPAELIIGEVRPTGVVVGPDGGPTVVDKAEAAKASNRTSLGM